MSPSLLFSPSLPPSLSLISILYTTAIESIITHPDEMENLEQYRVLDNYERKDSHQVSLLAGQIVHVIEKHDTGLCLLYMTYCVFVCMFKCMPTNW